MHSFIYVSTVERKQKLAVGIEHMLFVSRKNIHAYFISFFIEMKIDLKRYGLCSTSRYAVNVQMHNFTGR